MDRYTEYHGEKTDEETKMDKITTEFAEHICDNLCRDAQAAFMMEYQELEWMQIFKKNYLEAPTL